MQGSSPRFAVLALSDGLRVETLGRPEVVAGFMAGGKPVHAEPLPIGAFDQIHNVVRVGTCAARPGLPDLPFGVLTCLACRHTFRYRTVAGVVDELIGAS